MKKNRVRFWLVYAACLLLLTDTLLYAVLRYVGTRRKIFYGSTALSEEKIEGWLQTSHHPVLGWDLPSADRNNLGARRSSDYAEKSLYKLKLFGDSFTMGEEVSADECFASVIEQRTGWDCINFGVGGYGPDQALLKYELKKIRTEYTVLGLLDENIGRVVSHYPAFYMREWMPPKPRFIRKHGGFRLIKNPISTPEHATRLRDDRFIESLKQNDYWPRYYEKKLGAPEKLQWPALYTVFRHLPFFATNFLTAVRSYSRDDYQTARKLYKYTHLYDPPSEGLETLIYVIEEFRELTRQRGEKLIVIVFADQFSIDLMKKYDKSVYAPLTSFLESNGYAFLDMGEIFARDDHEPYFNYYNSHYSPAGNIRVAEELITLINELEEPKVQ